jgi:hypothetical protein
MWCLEPVWYRKKPFSPWAPSSFCLTRLWKFAQNKKHCLWASSVPNTDDREFFWWLHLTQKFQHHFFKQNPHTLCNSVKPQGKPLLSYSIDGFPPKLKKKTLLLLLLLLLFCNWPFWLAHCQKRLKLGRFPQNSCFYVEYILFGSPL